MPTLSFVTGQPALVFNRNLVVADLHIGIEYELYKSGIKVPTQIEKMKEKIDSLIKKTKTKRLVVIGDIKHQVPGVSMQELREVPEFFSYFSSKIETHICLGNHDSEIPALVENVNIHDTDGFKLEDAYIMHGHSWPKKEFLDCKYLIISHTHPLIEFRDKLGYSFSERVWVKAEFDRKKLIENKLFNKKLKQKYIQIKKLPEIILMPAFNDLSGGVPINSENSRRLKPISETFLGPMTQLIDKKKTELFLLDGTFLGKLHSLKKASY